MRSLASELEFLTKLPSAPAALARVFSSGSRSRSTSMGTTGLNYSYNLSLWNPALPTAKQANFLVFLSGSYVIMIDLKPSNTWCIHWWVRSCWEYRRRNLNACTSCPSSCILWLWCWGRCCWSTHGDLGRRWSGGWGHNIPLRSDPTDTRCLVYRGWHLIWFYGYNTRRLIGAEETILGDQIESVVLDEGGCKLFILLVVPHQTWQEWYGYSYVVPLQILDGIDGEWHDILIVEFLDNQFEIFFWLSWYNYGIPLAWRPEKRFGISVQWRDERTWNHHHMNWATLRWILVGSPWAGCIAPW